MAVMLAFLKVPLTWGEIFKRTFNEAFTKDNCLGMAAQLAYYFFFALFPALLFLVALASYFPAYKLVDDMFRTLGGYVPPEALTIMTDQLRKISEGNQGGLLTLGVLTALWSTSSAMTAIIDTLNAAYDIEEGRPWWHVRLIAIGLTVSIAIFILISMALLLIGPSFIERMLGATLGPWFTFAWNGLRWPVLFVLVSAAIALIYYYAPDAEQDWVWLTPGSLLATLLWLLASLGFKYYVANMGSYTETYGAIGGVMVLMLWFYISGLVILVGAELNAEIEHASPYGKEEGEKVPGEKRKIGPARMRAWIAARKSRGAKPPSSKEVKETVGEPPADLTPPSPTEGQAYSSPQPAPPARRRQA
jgi:membrane protein